MNSKNILAFNTVTGAFWGGSSVGFVACRDEAVAVDASELAVLRATYLNCAHETVPEVNEAGHAFLLNYPVGGLLTRADTLREVKRKLRGFCWTTPTKASVEKQVLHLIECRKLRPAVVGPRAAKGYEVLA